MEGLKRTLFLLLLGVGGAFVVRGVLVEGIYLASDSMAPTLNTNDHVLVNKLAFYLRSPRRGEIVVFHVSKGAEKDLVKRVIAIGGDTIAIRRKNVYLNGELLNEPYVQFLKPDVMLKGDNIPPTLIPKGSVFVMGDNRDFSGDSRDWRDAEDRWTPFVPFAALKGRVILSK